eukprot:GFUD01075188.1.p1 GENE.GFUD01075188.1~~GFUD01075188.1.p1  ORF type:complete len:613 (-),score=151.65 GFUD01075188.1:74-1912(-)
MWFLLLVSLVLISFAVLYLWNKDSKASNPFRKDARVPRKPYIHDQKKRDAVLKQGFSKDKIPANLDAILIGSGIGGLTTAAIMAKAGKRVLMLEQHDQAGGCCHTFIDKNYEFDVGIHYIGEMGCQTLNKTIVDQISEGQVEWAPLDHEFDVCQIGYEKEARVYPVSTGTHEWMKQLKKRFPEESKAIEKYFSMMKTTKASTTIHGALKLLPLWLVKLILASRILHLITNLYKPEYTKCVLDLVKGLTSNKDLQTVFLYSWGDYGTQPSKGTFMMQALLNRHFLKFGTFYPVGGASELAFNIIPVIEKAGGKVLVRAPVSEILTNRGKVCGVRVTRGSTKEGIDIFAPIIISNAGLYNTFEQLLPKTISAKSYYTDICKGLKPGMAAMNVFVGMNKSGKELKLKKHSIWAYANNDVNNTVDDYFAQSIEDALGSEIPLLFISFPSAKDPEWNNHPGRENKSTCTIIALANWDWFKTWEDKAVKKRGDEYDEVKNTIGHQMIEQTCKIFPQMRDCIDFTDIGSPVTNKHYIAQPHGELYGLDHSVNRFDPLTVAKLRPQTDVPGLFLTGQDILTCGFTGAMFGGVLAAQAVMGRNVMADAIALKKQLKEKKKK